MLKFLPILFRSHTSPFLKSLPKVALRYKPKRTRPAAMHTILASTIMPMVNFFGGQDVQSAWLKSILVFGALGIIFLYLNVFFVKERVKNSAPPENIIVGIKAAVKNKYWIYTLFANIMLVFNLSVPVYYLNTVVSNPGLMSAYVTVSNIPGVVLMIFLPSILTKVSKQRLAVFGSVLMLVAQIAFILGPSDNVTKNLSKYQFYRLFRHSIGIKKRLKIG